MKLFFGVFTLLALLSAVYTAPVPLAGTASLEKRMKMKAPRNSGYTTASLVEKPDAYRQELGGQNYQLAKSVEGEQKIGGWYNNRAKKLKTEALGFLKKWKSGKGTEKDVENYEKAAHDASGARSRAKQFLNQASRDKTNLVKTVTKQRLDKMRKTMEIAAATVLRRKKVLDKANAELKTVDV